MGWGVVVAIGVSVASAVISMATAPDVVGSRLDKLDSPKADYGNSLPKIYGKARLTGTLIWAKSIKEVKKVSGGKGLGIGPKNIDYKYYGTFAVVFCEGVINYGRIYFNSKLVYDPFSPSGESQEESSKLTNYMAMYRGTSDQQPDSTIVADKGSGKTPAFRGKAYIVFRDLPLADYGNTFPTVSAELIESENPDLSTVVNQICLDAGIDSAKLETSELSDRFTGCLAIQNGEAYKDLILELSQVFNFYATEDRNGKIVFKKFERPNIKATIPGNDIACRDYGSERLDDYTIIRTQSSEIPTKVSVTFRNPNLQFNADTQIANTARLSNSNTLSIDTSLSLTRSEAKFAASVILQQLWIQRNRFENITLPPKWLNALLAGDVINYPLNDSTLQSIQIRNIEIGANYQIQIKGNNYLGTAYNYSSSATDIPEEFRYNFIKNPSVFSGSYSLVALDISLFIDPTDQKSFYLFPRGNNPSWSNGIIWISLDNELSYNSLMNTNRLNISGQVINQLLNTKSKALIDKESKIIVNIDSGTLSSITQVEQLNGLNIALVGNEIISFKNANAITQTQYELSYICRGLFNTEKYINTHVAGEIIYFLATNDSLVLTTTSTNYNYGQNFNFKLTAEGQDIGTVPTVAFTYNGVHRKPFSQAHIKAEQSEEMQWIEFSWVHRDRNQNDTEKQNSINLYDINDVAKYSAGFFGTSHIYPYTKLLQQFGDYPDYIKVGLIRISSVYSNSDENRVTIPLYWGFISDENNDRISDEANERITEF